jgi:hypothetical protein
MRSLIFVLIFCSQNIFAIDVVAARKTRMSNYQNFFDKAIDRACYKITEIPSRNRCVANGKDFMKKYPTPCRRENLLLYRYNMISEMCGKNDEVPKFTASEKADCYFYGYAELFPLTDKQMDDNKNFKRENRELYLSTNYGMSNFRLAIKDPCIGNRNKAGSILSTPSYASCFEGFLNTQIGKSKAEVEGLADHLKNLDNDQDLDCGTNTKDVDLDVGRAMVTIDANNLIGDPGPLKSRLEKKGAH